MIRKTIYTLCLALCSIVIIAQPNMEFDSKSVNFGTIIEGTISKHRFNYKNTGNQPLIIEHVSVTCGCTAPVWSKTPLQPGDTASLYIEFNSANKMGQIAKGVNLMTNCPEPLIGLLVYADIIPDPSFTPIIDSTTYFPIKTLDLKSLTKVMIPLQTLTLKGFDGNMDAAEKVLYHVLQTDQLLFKFIGITSENGMIVANMLDINLKVPFITLVKKEMLNKKRLKYWEKRVKSL